MIVVFLDAEFSIVVGRNRADVVSFISFDEFSDEDSIDWEP